MPLDELFWGSMNDDEKLAKIAANKRHAEAGRALFQGQNEHFAKSPLGKIQDRSTNDEIVSSFMESNSFATFKDTRQLFYYDDMDHIYKETEPMVRSMLEQRIPNISKNRKNEIIDKLKDRTLVDRERFDNYPNWLHVNNGWINVMTLEFKAHSPNMLSLSKIPWDYEVGARCPAISKFLYDTLDHKYVLTVERMFGYILLEDQRFEKAFFFIGQGANGKSTMLNIIETFVGKENSNAASLQELNEEADARADLFGKKVNINADLGTQKLKHTEQFKKLTSQQDTVRGRQLYQRAVEFKSHAKLIFAMNVLPESEDESDGFLRRFIIVPFNRSFLGESADVDLLQKLVTPREMSGLLNLALLSLKKLLESGFEHEDIREVREKMKDGTNRYRQIIKDNFELSPELESSKDVVRAEIARLCTKEGIDVLDQQEIGRVLTELGITSTRPRFGKSRVQVYKGIGKKVGQGDQQHTLGNISKVVQDHGETTMTTMTGIIHSADQEQKATKESESNHVEDTMSTETKPESFGIHHCEKGCNKAYATKKQLDDHYKDTHGA